MGHLDTSKKRKYRYAKVMAGTALAAAQEAERQYQSTMDIIEGYGIKGEELARLTQEDITKLTPFLQENLRGMYADPRMGPVALKSILGRQPELVQAGRRVKEGLDLPSVYTFKPMPMAEGEEVASIRRVASKAPWKTLELTGEETEALMPIAERASEWAGMRFPIAMGGAKATDYAETYNQKIAEYQRWKAVESRYRRKHAHTVNKWKRIGTLALAAIATIVSFGALGPVAGAIGGTAAGTAFGAGGIGTILTTTALGAAGGAISGGWKGALIGGIGGLAGGYLGGMGAGGEVAAAPTQAVSRGVGEAATFATRMSPITGELVSTLPTAAQAGGGLFGLGTMITAPQTAGVGLGGQLPGGLSGMLKSMAPYAKGALKLGGKAYKSFDELSAQDEYMRRLLGEYEWPEMPELPQPELPVTT